MVSMRPPIPAEDRIPPVSRVIAEALVRRQGPSRIVTRATRLGLSPVLTRAVVVACAASALDSDGIVAKQLSGGVRPHRELNTHCATSR